MLKKQQFHFIYQWNRGEIHKVKQNIKIIKERRGP